MVDLTESDEFSAIAFNICKAGVQQYPNSSGELYITTVMISVPEQNVGRRPIQTQGGSTI